MKTDHQTFQKKGNRKGIIRKIYLFSFIIIIAFTVKYHFTGVTGISNPTPSIVNHSIPVNQYASYEQVFKTIQSLEYNIQVNDSSESFMSFNRQQQFNTSYTAKEINLKSIDKSWQLSLNLLKISQGKKAYTISNTPNFAYDHQELWVYHPKFSIQYENKMSGTRQNFIINEHLEADKPIEVLLNIESSLKPVQKSKTDILLGEERQATKSFINKIWYKNLKVWDSNKKILPSALQLRGNQLAILVDTKDALFPITIDPEFTTFDWESEGQPNSTFGRSVSSAGDVNGDGYSDLIAASFLSNPASTATIYLFEGSSSGLSANPVWSYSITSDKISNIDVSLAGDVNGDGFSDIIMGVEGISNIDLGTAYVFHGSSSGLSNMPDFSISMTPRTHKFGEVVGCAGDVNADGYSDVFVGDSYFESQLATPSGCANIYFGSGFKVAYREGDVVTDLDELGRKMTNAFQDFCKSYGRDLEIWFEPGKFMVSDSGILLVRTNVIKTTPATVFVGVDSGMNHLIRPMFYESYHDMINISNPEGTERIYTIVGYICETDTLGWDRKLNEVREGDIIAIKNAGAYGMSMASNYNARLRPAEVLIQGGEAKLIRKRETLEDLVHNQVF